MWRRAPRNRRVQLPTDFRENGWRLASMHDFHFGSRLCENHSADHLGAKLIQTARLTRIKCLLRLGLRFYRCVPTTASSVFTQPRPKADVTSPYRLGLIATRAS